MKYGIFDLQQLHRELRSEEDPTQGKQLMISNDGVHALEQFVLAKYYLTAQVYSHRVRLITDHMIVRAIKLGIEMDGIDELSKLYLYDGSEAFVESYMEWDDARFLLTFGDPKLKGTYCQELVARLRSRRLVKQVFECPFPQLPEECQDKVRDITKPQNRDARRRLEQALADALQSAGVHLQCDCGRDPSHLVIVNAYTLKSVRSQSRNDEGPILVRKGNSVTTFEEASDLFRSIDEKMIRPHFALYAPVEYGNPAERRKLQVRLREPILQCPEGFKNEQ